MVSLIWNAEKRKRVRVFGSVKAAKAVLDAFVSPEELPAPLGGAKQTVPFVLPPDYAVPGSVDAFLSAARPAPPPHRGARRVRRRSRRAPRAESGAPPRAGAC